MAKQNVRQNPLRIDGGDCVMVSGKFFPAGAGAPTYDTNDKHRAWTVERTAAGTFVITLRKRYARLDSGTVTLQLAAVGVHRPLLGPVSLSGKTVTIYVVDETDVEADVAANANNAVNFQLVFAKGKSN